MALIDQVAADLKTKMKETREQLGFQPPTFHHQHSSSAVSFNYKNFVLLNKTNST
jgi:hypothetical protein